eukprot:2463274-Amphidinium_carterae.1
MAGNMAGKRESVMVWPTLGILGGLLAWIVCETRRHGSMHQPLPWSGACGCCAPLCCTAS